MTEKDYHKLYKPDLTPREILLRGSFGGTYYREIYSPLTNKTYKNQHLEFDFLKDIDESLLICPKYDKNKNKYKVKVGLSYKEWLKNGWIQPIDPYGNFQWMCRYYSGRRCYDDERQIKRWLAFKKRFTGMLDKKISEGRKKEEFPKIEQSLQHWGIVYKEKK